MCNIGVNENLPQKKDRPSKGVDALPGSEEGDVGGAAFMKGNILCAVLSPLCPFKWQAWPRSNSSNHQKLQL